jgi:hypothetical protein
MMMTMMIYWEKNKYHKEKQKNPSDTGKDVGIKVYDNETEFVALCIFTRRRERVTTHRY